MPGSLRITDPPSSTLFSLSGFCSEGEFNMHVKSFVRPERVDLSIVNPHYFGSKEGEIYTLLYRIDRLIYCEEKMAHSLKFIYFYCNLFFLLGYSQVLYDGTPMNGPWSMKPDPRASVLHFRFFSHSFLSLSPLIYI